MRTRPTLLLTLLAAGALTLGTAGCVNNAATGPESAGAVNDIGVDAAASALVPEAIAKTGTLVIGTDPTYPPNEFKDQAGAPTGWGVDLMAGAAAKLGLEPSFKVSNFDKIIPSIRADAMQVGQSSFIDNPEREKQVDFVNYYEAGIMWAAPTGKPVDPTHACGLTVAVQTTTYQETVELPEKSAACEAAGEEKISILSFEAQESASNAVVLGRADAMTAAGPVTLYAVSRSKDALEPVGDPFHVAPYGFAVKKESGMAEALQAALQSMVDDGSYGEILKAYGVEAGGLDTITINAGTAG